MTWRNEVAPEVYTAARGVCDHDHYAPCDACLVNAMLPMLDLTEYTLEAAVTSAGMIRHSVAGKICDEDVAETVQDALLWALKHSEWFHPGEKPQPKPAAPSADELNEADRLAAWAAYHKEHPEVLASWAEQNGRWPHTSERTT